MGPPLDLPHRFRAEARPRRLVALTFDLWNTIYSADGPSGAVVRSARMRLLQQALAEHGVHPGERELKAAYHDGHHAYVAAWTSGRHFGARERVLHMLSYFHLPEAAHDHEVIEETARAIEETAWLSPPTPLPGIREVIPTLAAAGYRLGLISDTSITPGRVLRQFLEKDGLAEHFTVLTFSDETGFPKPDPRMFRLTLARLGWDEGDAAPLGQAAHIGDTPRTDIAGAQAVGMIAIRYAGANDDQEPPAADFVIGHHGELLELLLRLEKR